MLRVSVGKISPYCWLVLCQFTLQRNVRVWQHIDRKNWSCYYASNSPAIMYTKSALTEVGMFSKVQERNAWIVNALKKCSKKRWVCLALSLSLSLCLWVTAQSFQARKENYDVVSQSRCLRIIAICVPVHNAGHCDSLTQKLPPSRVFTAKGAVCFSSPFAESEVRLRNTLISWTSTASEYEEGINQFFPLTDCNKFITCKYVYTVPHISQRTNWCPLVIACLLGVCLFVCSLFVDDLSMWKLHTVNTQDYSNWRTG